MEQPASASRPRYYIKAPQQPGQTPTRPSHRASTSSLSSGYNEQAGTSQISTGRVTPVVPANLRHSVTTHLAPTNLTSRPRSPIRRPISSRSLREDSKSATSREINNGSTSSVTVMGLSNDSGLSSGRLSSLSLRTRVRTLSNASQLSVESIANKKGNVQVLVRVRPFLQREIDAGSNCLVQMNSKAHTTTIVPHIDESSGVYEGVRSNKAQKEFVFDESLWSVNNNTVNEFVDQKTLYKKVGQEFLDHSLDGYHTCILAYGQTGSGKSYTMIGTPEEPGIIPQTCNDLFQRIEKMTTATTSFTVKVSYFEIYNEHVFDLLAPTVGSLGTGSTSLALKVRESPIDGPYVKDLSMFSVRSFEEVIRYLENGNKQRATAATKMNASSSRSHAVFTINLKRVQSDLALDETIEETTSRIRFVDLAGSERANSTGATGSRLREGANINKSLTTLGRVISVLADSALDSRRKEIVPYRDSVLTWLLKDNLGGNSKTAMIACISPCDYEETLSTLRYASQAQHIRTRAIINQDFISATERDQKLQELQETIKTLQESLATSASTHKQESDSHEQEVERFRNVMQYYEDQAATEESKRRAIVQENETLRRHNRLIAEHVKDMRRNKAATDATKHVPEELTAGWRELIEDAVRFREQMRADVGVY
ncbi:P-loop containing nucleoside triphosphate hydrolase protein [Lipomyces oligophaga]|uniref:P-loop containing nucleoside triphosphate hydrolase protein n=1 Tax=Lipomyces oligophaga TaxID=45792 RepID=UPI0034CE69E3